MTEHRSTSEQIAVSGRSSPRFENDGSWSLQMIRSKIDWYRPFGKIVGRELRRSKGALISAGLSMVALTATDLLRPWPLKVIIDTVLLGHPLPELFSPADAWVKGHPFTALVITSSLIVVIAVFRGMFAFVESYQMARVGNQIAFTLRTSLFRHLHRLPLSFHHASQRGEMMSKLGADTRAVKNFVTDSALLLGSHALSIGGTFLVMFLMNWKLTLIVLATFPLLVWTMYRLHQSAHRSARKQRAKEDQLSNQINEVLGSMHLIQAFGRQSYEEARFQQASRDYLDESLENSRIESAAGRTVELTTAIGTAAVVLFGAWSALRGSMTPGTILIFCSYLHGLYRPIRRLIKQTIRVSRLRVSIRRMNELLRLAPDIVEASDPLRPERVSGLIEVRDVSFRYPNSPHPALDNVSLRIEPGEHVALVGSSGAGKSTLLSLLLRLYDPQSGCILLDGHDLRSYAIDSIRQQYGIVMQDSMLLGATVYENIRYGNLDANEGDIVRAARQAHADEFIRKLRDGYQTVVGERGATLSGGQQRRLAIARALVRDASILVLDEPMTGLDAESVRHVATAIEAVRCGRTIITITHDFHTACSADRIIMLDRGRLVECGTPTALLEQPSRFRKMHIHQGVPG